MIISGNYAEIFTGSTNQRCPNKMDRLTTILDEKTKNAFIFCFCVSLIYTAPIIFFDGYYQDDLGRSLSGDTGWGYVGRPLADLLMSALNFGTPLTDISPIPQVVALLLAAGIIALLKKKYLETDNVFGALAFIPLVSSPFSLANWSFKFDSLPMMASIVFAILPFVVRDSRFTIRFFTCVICTIALLSLYQPSINVYIIFTTLNFLFLHRREQPTCALKLLATSALGLAVGYFVYSVFISPHFVIGGYANSHNEIINLMAPGGIHEVIANFDAFYSLILLLFTKTAIIALLPVLLAGCISIWAISVRSDIKASIPVKLITLSIPFVIFLCAVGGPMLLLKYPIFSARVLVGFSAAAAVAFTAFLWLIPIKLYFTRYILLLPCLFMLVITYSHGNSIRNQDKFETHVITMIAHDLSSERLSDVEFIAISGQMPNSPASELAYKKFPLLSHHTHVALIDDWIWGYRELNHYRIEKELWAPSREEMKSFICSASLIKSSDIYNIYAQGKYAVITFRPGRKIPGQAPPC